MSRLVVEATLIYTLVQFSNIIYLVLRKIVNFFNSFEGLTFAAGSYSTHINQKKTSFFLVFQRVSFHGGKIFYLLGKLSAVS